MSSLGWHSRGMSWRWYPVMPCDLDDVERRQPSLRPLRPQVLWCFVDISHFKVSRLESIWAFLMTRLELQVLAPPTPPEEEPNCSGEKMEMNSWEFNDKNGDIPNHKWINVCVYIYIYLVQNVYVYNHILNIVCFFSWSYNSFFRNCSSKCLVSPL